MFCIRSDVITHGSIEVYDLITIWTSMDDGLYWVILLMYGSHDMRHIGFHRLTVVNGTSGFWSVTYKVFKNHNLIYHNFYRFYNFIKIIKSCNPIHPP